MISAPTRIHVDSQGYVFFVTGNRVRAITPNGIIQTVMGTGDTEFNGDGRPALETNINVPTDMAVDANRNLLVAENSGRRIRMAPLGTAASLGGQAGQLAPGNTVTVAGTGEAGISEGRSLATETPFSGILGMALDSQGRIYVSEGGHRVRVLDPTLPLATAAGVVNGASFARLLAPGLIATAFVVNGAQQDALATVVPLPTSLGGTVVEIRDSQGVTHQSGILGIFNGQRQINFVIDAATAVGPATLTLRRADGETSSAAIQIGQVAPGVFFQTNAQSQPVALGNVLHFRGTALTVTNTFTPTLELAPIDLGAEGDQVFISLYVTGIQFASNAVNMSATLGGDALPVFSFAGSLEQFVGLGQVNVGPIPRSFLGRGPALLALTMDGVAANAVMVSIQ
jgi:uncharacterized protein (TIGR03437 family)